VQNLGTYAHTCARICTHMCATTNTCAHTFTHVCAHKWAHSTHRLGGLVKAPTPCVCACVCCTQTERTSQKRLLPKPQTSSLSTCDQGLRFRRDATRRLGGETRWDNLSTQTIKSPSGKQSKSPRVSEASRLTPYTHTYTYTECTYRAPI
jgi:hypothetical protein